jgi:hypothetical protein
VIERFAFRACGLKHFDLTEAKNLERIGAEAFSDSCSLETVQFSPNIHVIERALFAGCRELREVQIYEHVVEIAEKAFMDTPKLESFDFAKATSLHRNGYQAFSGCKALTIAHFGPMVKTIGDEAFIHHRLRVVIFNELLETIGSRAFSCKYGHGNVFSEELLENVDFSRAQNLYRIGKQAFGCCISLTNIKLAKNIKILESKAFENCYRLKEIEMNSKLERIGDAAFAACHHLETVALPPGVKHIPANAFCDCSSLQRVVLPNSCESLGDAAFAFCELLEDVTMPPVISIGPNCFHGCKLLTVTYGSTKAIKKSLRKQNIYEWVRTSRKYHHICLDEAGGTPWNLSPFMISSRSFQSTPLPGAQISTTFRFRRASPTVV